MLCSPRRRQRQLRGAYPSAEGARRGSEDDLFVQLQRLSCSTTKKKEQNRIGTKQTGSLPEPVGIMAEKGHSPDFAERFKFRIVHGCKKRKRQKKTHTYSKSNYSRARIRLGFATCDDRCSRLSLRHLATTHHPTATELRKQPKESTALESQPCKKHETSKTQKDKRMVRSVPTEKQAASRQSAPSQTRSCHPPKRGVVDGTLPPT